MTTVSESGNISCRRDKRNEKDAKKQSQTGACDADSSASYAWRGRGKRAGEGPR